MQSWKHHNCRTLLYLSLCWNDDQNKELMIDTKIIYRWAINYYNYPISLHSSPLHPWHGTFEQTTIALFANVKSNHVVQTWVNCFGWKILFAAVVQKSPPKIFPAASHVLGNHLKILILRGSFLRGLTVSKRIFWFQCTLWLRILNWRGSQLYQIVQTR